MKKIILLLVFIFNLVPYLQHGEIHIGSVVYATGFGAEDGDDWGDDGGEGEYGDDGGGSTWNDFYSWLNDNGISLDENNQYNATTGEGTEESPFQVWGVMNDEEWLATTSVDPDAVSNYLQNLSLGSSLSYDFFHDYIQGTDLEQYFTVVHHDYTVGGSNSPEEDAQFAQLLACNAAGMLFMEVDNGSVIHYDTYILTGILPPTFDWSTIYSNYYNEPDWEQWLLNYLNNNNTGGDTTPIARDTVLPLSVNCLPDALNRDSLAEKIIDGANLSKDMDTLRAHVHGPDEGGLSIYDSSGNYKTYIGPNLINSPLNAQIVSFDTTTGPNHKNIIAIAHIHTDSADADFDAQDIYGLIGKFKEVNPNLLHSFVLSGQLNLDIAVTIFDSNAAKNYFTLHPKDCAIYYLDTAVIINPTTHDTTFIPQNPTWADCTPAGDTVSMKTVWDDAIQTIQKNNYYHGLEETFAEVYMMKRYNMGLKLSAKVNGIFKEITAQDTYNADGTLSDLKFTICL